MRLLACHIDNFGKLHDLDIRFDPALHVTASENGSGKSTLAAFLQAMFYGFEGEGRRDPVRNERLRYAPWQGGPYGGTLSFTAGGRAYRAERSFGTKKGADRFVLIDLETGLASSDFSDDLGRDLFGIDLASFRRTLFIGQLSRKAEPTGDIRARIGRDLQGAEDLAALDEALAGLEKRKKALSPDRASSALRREKERASALLAEASALEGLQEKEARVRAEILGLQDALGKARAALEDLEEASEEKEEKAPAFPALSLVPAGAGLVLLALRCFLPAILCLAACPLLYLLFRRKDREEEAEAGRRSRGDLAAAFRSLSKKILDLETALSSARDRQARLADQIRQAGEARLAYEKSCRDLSSLQQQYLILDKTLSHLTRAGDRFRARCAAPFEEAFASFYRVLAGGEPGLFETDASLHVSLREGGSLRDPELFSEGTRDLIALCRRLAMADAMYAGPDRPFLLLDDPFVNLDDDAVRSGLDLVRKLSEDRQVLYFTCHSGRIP